jgi:pyruvate dehydrogenase E1 component beta subunit
MATLNMVQAVNLALAQEMARDPSVVVLGEDVGRNGGVFRVTAGLWKQFGDERVIDTPLAEAGIIGTSIGMAIAGLKPVAEIQFDGFLQSGLDQLYSHAGRIRNRTRGRYGVPMVVRVPYGGGIRAPELHSEAPEAFYCHTPGIKVVIPSGPYDAKGLLISAIRDPDPVIFFEPKRIYRAFREEVPEDEYVVPLGKAKVLADGTDVTIITWGAMVHECLKAMDDVPEEISVELIDLRTVSPIDAETVLESVAKTGRAVVVHEAPKTCGLGAELAAIIGEKAMYRLKAPVLRVTGFDVPTPYYKLEEHYLPGPERIRRAVMQAAAL